MKKESALNSLYAERFDQITNNCFGLVFLQCPDLIVNFKKSYLSQFIFVLRNLDVVGMVFQSSFICHQFQLNWMCILWDTPKLPNLCLICGVISSGNFWNLCLFHVNSFELYFGVYVTYWESSFIWNKFHLNQICGLRDWLNYRTLLM